MEKTILLISDCHAPHQHKDTLDFLKAIKKKYGEEAINNPRRFWDDNKEKDYIEQSAEQQRKFAKLAESQDKVEQD